MDDSRTVEQRLEFLEGFVAAHAEADERDVAAGDIAQVLWCGMAKALVQAGVIDAAALMTRWRRDQADMARTNPAVAAALGKALDQLALHLRDDADGSGPVQ